VTNLYFDLILAMVDPFSSINPCQIPIRKG